MPEVEACESYFVIIATEAECPHCGGWFTYEEDRRGEVVDCGLCEREFSIG